MALALRDVPNRRRHGEAALRLQRAEADFDRELATALSSSEELEPGAHRTRCRTAEEALDVLEVSRAEALGDEKLELLPEQLVSGISEHLLGLHIHEANRPLRPDDDHGVRRGIEQLAVQQVATVPVRFRAHELILSTAPGLAGRCRKQLRD